MQISKLASKNQQYPPLLKEISNPPKNLYFLGKLPQENPCIAIVGSRKPTPYGKEITKRLTGELAGAGITIISGLAMGIDAIAHQTTLDAGGKTIGVLACGLNQIYPATNRNLAKKILERGGP